MKLGTDANHHTDATMSYGFRAQIRIMATRIRKWMDDAEGSSAATRQSKELGRGACGGFADQTGSKMNARSGFPRSFTGITLGRAF